jgi:MFS family permease
MGLLRVKPLRSVLVVSALISAGWDLFTFLAPLHGARSGLSATQIGIVAGAFGAGAAAMRLALPWLMRRFSERQLLRFALVASALGYFAFPFSRNVATMLPLAVWLGMVLGCGQPIVMSLLHATAPAGRTGEAVGLRTAITSFGQTWLPLASGAMGAALGSPSCAAGKAAARRCTTRSRPRPCATSRPPWTATTRRPCRHGAAAPVALAVLPAARRKANSGPTAIRAWAASCRRCRCRAACGPAAGCSGMRRCAWASGGAHVAHRVGDAQGGPHRRPGVRAGAA